MAEELKEAQTSPESAIIETSEGQSEDNGISHTTADEIVKPTGELQKVGYKMPPVGNRFKPGEQWRGNPGGQPKIKKVRKAMDKIGNLTPEQLETYKPKTILEMAALEMYKTTINPKRNSSAAVQAFNLIADRIDGKPKPSDEELDSNANKQVVVIGGGLIRKPTE
jgi:hypothetical protein